MRVISRKYAMTVCSVITLLLLWELLSFIIDNPILVPDLKTLGSALYSLFTTLSFYKILGYTLLRGSAGFCIAFVISVALAIPATRHPLFYQYIRPFLSILRSTPIISFILLLFIWISSDYIPLIMAIITMTPLLTENLVAGLSLIDKKLLEMSDVFLLTHRQKWSQIVYPTLKPFLFSGLVSSMGLGWKAIILGEALAQPDFGIGKAIKEAQNFVEIPLIIAWTIVALIISYSFEFLLKRAEKKNISIKFGSRNKMESPQPSDVSGSHIYQSYGKTDVFKDFSFHFDAGLIHAIMGNSGRGKTTLIHMICGIITPRQGKIKSVNCRFSVSFQEPRLLGHLTVLENIILPASRYMGRKDAEEKAYTILKELEIESCALQHPDELSGGQQQRVSLARMILFPSSCWLMDEPFKGLDLKLKEKIADLIKHTQQQKRKTIIFVTHEKEEALMADSIFTI